MRINTPQNIYKHSEKEKKNTGSMGYGLVILAMFIFMCLVIFCAFNYKISITEKLNETSKICNKIKKEITLRKKEIDCLKIEKEELSSWKHISRKIAQFNIKLRPADHDQIIIFRPKEPISEHHDTSIAMLSSNK